jgi:predicted Rossmann fold nucleotide-binding protein DprA/Smf involved in DNA uptake
VVIKRIHKSDPEYPASLQRYLAEAAPQSATAIGNLELLKQLKLAIFCSTTYPAAIVSQTEEVIQKLVDAGVTVIGGFHSPVERQCLSILLRGAQPIILSPARSLDKLRIRPEYKEPLGNGRLLLLSFFKSHRHRSDVEMALKRNHFVAALADRILTVHAAPSSKTEQLCRELISWQKPVYTIDNEANQNLVGLGAQTVAVGTVAELMLGRLEKTVIKKGNEPEGASEAHISRRP